MMDSAYLLNLTTLSGHLWPEEHLKPKARLSMEAVYCDQKRAPFFQALYTIVDLQHDRYENLIDSWSRPVSERT